MTPDAHRLAQTIDHTLLKPSAITEDIYRLCAEAIEWQFYSVCINSTWAPLAKKRLDGSNVKVVSTAAFPLGSASTQVKCFEVEQAIKNGADEVDFVQNIGWLKERLFFKIKIELQEIVKASQGRPLKIIIETSLLDDEEKVLACKLARDLGIAFVKTSTGFLGGGATIEDVALMKAAVGKKAQVKASGGIRDAASALQMLQAGATRLGTSAGVAIMHEFQA